MRLFFRKQMSLQLFTTVFPNVFPRALEAFSFYRQVLRVLCSETFAQRLLLKASNHRTIVDIGLEWSMVEQLFRPFTWFTWFTWFTILFCVLHFYILVRISSNVGFWIRFDLCMAFLPHITSASATARGGTAILGLCIARPSSSTAHAAPGLRCGRFQLTLALRANPLLVAITGF